MRSKRKAVFTETRGKGGRRAAHSVSDAHLGFHITLDSLQQPCSPLGPGALGQTGLACGSGEKMRVHK